MQKECWQSLSSNEHGKFNGYEYLDFECWIMVRAEGLWDGQHDAAWMVKIASREYSSEGFPQ